MKTALLLAVAVTSMLLNSCGLPAALARTAGGLVQAAGRVVGG